MNVIRAFQHVGLCATLLLSFGNAQAQFTDDFADGDFSTAPAWTGNTADFTVNANNELQSNGAAAGTSYLQSDHSMPSLDNQEWRFWIKQSFSPSGSNFGRVFLVSDQSDLSGFLNGYYLQFGEAGSNDAIELIEQSGGASLVVARGTDGLISSSFTLGIRVTRDAAGLWSIYADATGGTNYLLQATGTSTVHSSGAHLGVLCTYTSSNADNFYFDDFYAGPMVVDMDPPTISAVNVIDADNIEVVFNEAVELNSAQLTSNYDIQPFLSASSAVRDAADWSKVVLTLSSSMNSGSAYNLIVTGVEDLAGNPMPSTQFPYTYVVPDIADPREVVINEIMADPSPVVSLPEAEFIELYNASTTKNFDLANWTISDGSSTATLAAFTLLPNSYVIITDAGNAALFSAYTNVLGVASFPSLNNTGDALELHDNNGSLIDQVTYSSSWYNDGAKDDGGWTLEQINPFTPCSGPANWSASNNLSGGTPETQNSIFDNTPDTEAPSLSYISVANPSAITLYFDEDLDASSIAAATISTSPSLGISSTLAASANSVDVVLSNPMLAGVVYELSVTGITDCAGNAIGPNNSAQFGLPEIALAGDVLINEVLYDPVVNGSDFVELYNNSGKVIDLGSIYLANEVAGLVDNITQVNTQGLVLLPNDFVLLTEDLDQVESQYPGADRSKFLFMDLPSYNNGDGVVYLLNQTAEELDRFAYDDDLHFSLLSETEGVSLERVSPSRSSSDNSNWHSASENVYWGTPGYENSQFVSGTTASGEMSIEPAIFSPDLDGYQDVLTINYQFERQGTVATVRVYDLAGRAIRTLMENELLGSSGAVSWDGITDENEKARIGAYVVLMEAFDLSGNTEVFKQTVTLAHQL